MVRKPEDGPDSDLSPQAGISEGFGWWRGVERGFCRGSRGCGKARDFGWKGRKAFLRAVS